MERDVSDTPQKEQKRAVTWRLPESLISRVQEEYEEIRSLVPPKERSRFTVGDAVVQLLHEALEVRAAQRSPSKK